MVGGTGLPRLVDELVKGLVIKLRNTALLCHLTRAELKPNVGKAVLALADIVVGLCEERREVVKLTKLQCSTWP